MIWLERLCVGALAGYSARSPSDASPTPRPAAGAMARPLPPLGSPMGQVTELSHTADVGFEVEAGSPEELFELAAAGLLRAVGLDRPGAPGDGGQGAEAGREAGDLPPGSGASRPEGEAEELRLSRPDLDRLLVDWLRELLYRTTRDMEVPEAAVERVEVPADGPASLRARVRWRPAGGREPEREIKGVTYHGLEVRERDGGWHARVVLDV